MSSYKSFSVFWREVVKDSMHRMISEKVECISGKILGMERNGNQGGGTGESVENCKR